MSMLHESLKRMLVGATLRGSVTPLPPLSARATAFLCRVERIESGRNMHQWSGIIAVPVESEDARVACEMTVRWADAVPVISLHDLELPGVGTVERAELIIHNGLFAGMWVSAGVRGHVLGVVEPVHKSEQHAACYVIERTGEALREWWTGNGWTEDDGQVRWYEHEPDAPRETADEGAHAVFYPRGVIEPG